MSHNPHANGVLLLKQLRMPDFRDYAVELPSPGAVSAEATRSQGKFLRDVMKLSKVIFRLQAPPLRCRSSPIYSRFRASKLQKKKEFGSFGFRSGLFGKNR